MSPVSTPRKARPIRAGAIGGITSDRLLIEGISGERVAGFENIFRRVVKPFGIILISLLNLHHGLVGGHVLLEQELQLGLRDKQFKRRLRIDGNVRFQLKQCADSISRGDLLDQSR